MSQRTFRTFNPLKNTFNNKSHTVNTVDEVNALLDKAKEAQLILGQKTNENIGQFLLTIKDKLLEIADELQIVYCEESGLGENRFKNEFARTVDQLVLFSNYLKSKNHQSDLYSKEEIADKIFIKKKIGIGTVLILGASNFPLAYSTMGGDSIAALASKNPIIVKAHPFHAGTSSMVSTVVHEAVKEMGFPIGTFSHILDDKYDLATYTAGHEYIKAIGFTGSQLGGEAILKIANNRKNPIPVFAEMGSSNPVIILNSFLENGDTSLAKKIANSVCTDAGQFCTKPGLLFIPNNIAGVELSQEVKAEVLRFPDHPMLQPSIQRKFENSIQMIRTHFGESLFSEASRSTGVNKQFPERSILISNIKELSSHPFLQEEIFGPHVSIFHYDNESELIPVLNQLRGQLTFSIFSTKQDAFLESLTQVGVSLAGRIIFNDMPTGVNVCASMHHGGPYPASSDSRFTAVGTDSIKRFQRSVTIQDFRI